MEWTEISPFEANESLEEGSNGLHHCLIDQLSGYLSITGPAKVYPAVVRTITSVSEYVCRRRGSGKPCSGARAFFSRFY